MAIRGLALLSFLTFLFIGVGSFRAFGFGIVYPNDSSESSEGSSSNNSSNLDISANRPKFQDVSFERVSFGSSKTAAETQATGSDTGSESESEDNETDTTHFTKMTFHKPTLGIDRFKRGSPPDAEGQSSGTSQGSAFGNFSGFSGPRGIYNKTTVGNKKVSFGSFSSQEDSSGAQTG